MFVMMGLKMSAIRSKQSRWTLTKKIMNFMIFLIQRLRSKIIIKTNVNHLSFLREMYISKTFLDRNVYSFFFTFLIFLHNSVQWLFPQKFWCSFHHVILAQCASSLWFILVFRNLNFCTILRH